jgi:predicted ATPase
MRLRELKIKNFRNLKNFHIRFDDESITVLLGKNGAAKSNLIEAITSIFAELDYGANPSFNYWLHYEIGENTKITIDAGFISPAYNVSIGAEQLSYEAFVTAEEDYEGDIEFRPEKMRRKYASYLPSNVIVYYSGLSDRLQCYNKPVKEKYREELLKGEDPSLRRVFLTDGSHSPLILFAFLLDDNDWANNFLADKLGIERLESVRLTISRPVKWPERVNRDEWLEDFGLIPTGEDARFFRIEGELLQTLRNLESISIPLRETYTVVYSEPNTKQEKSALKGQEELNRLHLFFHHKHSDPRQLYKAKKIVEGGKAKEVPPAFARPKQLFQRLEDLRLAGFELEFSYKLKVKGAKELIPLRYLSEGEQQLLTVIGLLRFTRDNDTLFLLDEPDTHLNPQWSYEYKRMLEDAMKNDDGKEDKSSQIIMATHDPILIAGLLKTNVRLMERVDIQNGKGAKSPEEIERSVNATPPNDDPRGLGIARILTSRMFGLRSILDEDTLRDLDKRRELAFKEHRSEEETEELKRLTRKLQDIDLTYLVEDPLYSHFVNAVVNHKDYFRLKKLFLDNQEFADLERIALEVRDDLLKGLLERR